MAGEELQVVRLRTEFYRDGFIKVLFALAMILAAVGSLVALSLYLHFTKPAPVYFSTDNEWRVLPPIPTNVPYISDSDLLQWIGSAIPEAFTYDFLSYQNEQQNVVMYFTPKGWENLLGQLKNYHLDYASLQNSKMFVVTHLTGAPIILNEGLLPDGKYAWKIQIPVDVSYSNNRAISLVIVALVVRIPTLNYIYGVGIDDMSITEAQANQVKTNV